MEEKRGEVLNKPLFREVFLKRLVYLQSKRIVKEQEVYNLARDFFKEFLQIDYEFTKEELEEEFKKVYLDNKTKQRIELFLKSVFKIQYSDTPMDDRSLRVVLDDFRKLVLDLIPKRNKTTLLDRLLRRKQVPVIESRPEPHFQAVVEDRPKVEGAEKVEAVKPEVRIPEEQPAQPPASKAGSNPPQGEEHKKVHKRPVNKTHGGQAQMHKKMPAKAVSAEKPLKPAAQEKSVALADQVKERLKGLDPKAQVETLLGEIDDLISSDMQQAKAHYKRLNEVYNGLNEDDKIEFFTRMNGLYHKLKNTNSSQGS